MDERTGRVELAAPAGQGVEANELSLAVRALSLAIRNYERQLATRMNLKPVEYQAIEHILDGEGHLGPLELASRLGLAPGTTTEMLDRLQQLGHVVRERDATDGRRVKLAPTAGSTQRILAAISPAMTDLDRVGDAFEPSEQDVILRFLQEARHALEAHTEPIDQPRKRSSSNE